MGNRVAKYIHGSGTKSLKFRYSVEVGDSTPRLDVLISDGASIQYQSTEDFIAVARKNNEPSIVAVNNSLPGQGLSNNQNITIDTSPPQVIEVTSPLNRYNNVTYSFGESVYIEVKFTKPVTVSAPNWILSIFESFQHIVFS